MKKLSVVVCVYNEEGNIKPLVDAIHKELDGIEYEIVYVDDGSRDNTIREIKELNDPSIILVEFQKNYGQSSALAAGIDIATGEFIATIDGDLQNDPADIPAMIKMAEEGDFDMVAGIRANRQDNIIRKIPSKIANFFIRVTTGVKMKDYGCTLKVFRSKTAKSIGLYGELHRFIPVLVNLEGGSIAQKEVLHHPRIRGHSKYGMGRTLKVVSDLLLMLFFKKYMRKPMHLFGTLGILLFSGGVVIDMYMLILWLTS
ncbi:MAG: glycosyltransferase family 2 protein [Bacteroidetes bacterium]|nr:glycosyltransferase family 2 protein [Bacteroidota bacterium]